MSVAVVVALAVVMCAALLHATDLARQAAVQRAMDGVLTRRGRDTLDEVSLQVREHRHVLGAYHGRARRLRDQGRHAEAAQRLDVGCRALAELAPDFLSALRSLRQLARSVSVIVAVPPLDAAALRTPRLQGLARAGAALHELLLTGKQRVLLRLHVAATAFRLALRYLQRACDRLARRPADPVQWHRVDALVSDLGTAGDEALVTVHQIVQALDAIDLGQPAVHRADL